MIGNFGILTEEEVTELKKKMTKYIQLTIQNKEQPNNLQRYRSVTRSDSIHSSGMPCF